MAEGRCRSFSFSCPNPASTGLLTFAERKDAWPESERLGEASDEQSQPFINVEPDAMQFFEAAPSSNMSIMAEPVEAEPEFPLGLSLKMQTQLPTEASDSDASRSLQVEPEPLPEVFGEKAGRVKKPRGMLSTSLRLSAFALMTLSVAAVLVKMLRSLAASMLMRFARNGNWPDAHNSWLARFSGPQVADRFI